MFLLHFFRVLDPFAGRLPIVAFLADILRDQERVRSLLAVTGRLADPCVSQLPEEMGIDGEDVFPGLTLLSGKETPR